MDLTNDEEHGDSTLCIKHTKNCPISGRATAHKIFRYLFFRYSLVYRFYCNIPLSFI